MRIAYVLAQFPALSETFVLNQITGLIDRGHTVDIYADRPSVDSRVHPDVDRYGLLARTHHAPRMPGNALARLIKGIGLATKHIWSAPRMVGRSLNVFRYGRQAVSLKLLYRAVPYLPQCPAYDVIHAHFGPNGLRALALRDLGVVRGKLVTTFQGHDLSAYLRKSGSRVYDVLLARGDLCLANSDQLKASLLKLGCVENKIRVHRNGIDCALFKFKPRHIGPRQTVRLVSLARLVEKKGIEYALRALGQLRHEAFEYDIVGDGPLRRSLERLARELELESRVRFLGWRHQGEVAELLDQAHILLAPSVTSRDGDQEGIPVALMEAMAVGLPVVSTLHSGIPELVEDARSGFIVPERDVDALRDRLKRLIAAPGDWPALGTAGRQRVEDAFNIHRQNDKLVETFLRLAGKKS